MQQSNISQDGGVAALVSYFILLIFDFSLSLAFVGTNLNPTFQEYHSIHGGDYYYYDIDCRTRSSIRFVASFDYDDTEF